MTWLPGLETGAYATWVLDFLGGALASEHVIQRHSPWLMHSNLLFLPCFLYSYCHQVSKKPPLLSGSKFRSDSCFCLVWLCRHWYCYSSHHRNTRLHEGEPLSIEVLIIILGLETYLLRCVPLLWFHTHLTRQRTAEKKGNSFSGNYWANAHCSTTCCFPCSKTRKAQHALYNLYFSKFVGHLYCASFFPELWLIHNYRYSVLRPAPASWIKAILTSVLSV